MPYPAVVKASPGSFSRDDLSAERSISSWENHALLRRNAANTSIDGRTCSAPFSFSGRLRTSAFVNRVIIKLSQVQQPNDVCMHASSYLDVLSKKFRRYFLLSTSGAIASAMNSKARTRSLIYCDCPVTSSWLIHVVRVNVDKAGSHTASNSRRRTTIATDATLYIRFRQERVRSSRLART